MIGQSKLFCIAYFFIFSLVKLQAQQKGIFFPENLVDLKEFISQRYFVWFSESPYREFEKYLFSAEKLIEMGLFREAERDIDKAERLLQLQWSIERREKGISRNLPTVEEFFSLNTKQQIALESYLAHKLDLAFIKEELFGYLSQKEKLLEIDKEIKKSWEDYFLYFKQKEAVYYNLVLLRENLGPEKILSYIPKEKKNELSQRLLYRHLMRLLVDRGDFISAYYVYEEYVKLIEKKLPPLAEARYMILFGQLAKALNILTDNYKSEIQDFADFYVQYEIRILRAKLLLVLNNLQKAKNEIRELKNFLEKFARENLPKEVFIALEEKRYALLLEASALGGEEILDAPNPAFSQETQIKFSWFRNKKTSEFWEYQKELFPYWEFDQDCLANKSPQIYFLADWAFRLVFYTTPKCSWPVFEKKLLQNLNEFSPEFLFHILEERYQMEKRHYSFFGKRSFITFLRHYLLKDRSTAILPFVPMEQNIRDRLFFYESPFYLMAFSKGNFFFWEKNDAEIDLTKVFNKIQIEGSEVWLRLYGDAHRLAFEEFFLSGKVFVFRELWQAHSCEICHKNFEWYAFGFRQESTLFFTRKEIMDDIFAAFSNYTLLALSEKNFLEKVKEKMEKNYQILLHLLGKVQLKDSSLQVFFQGLNLLDIADLRFLPNVGGLVLQEEQSVDLFPQLASIAGQAGVDFFILPNKKYEADFSVSFFYDFYYRMVRKKIKPNLAFQESYLRYLKTLGEKKIPPILVFYGRN